MIRILAAFIVSCAITATITVFALRDKPSQPPPTPTPAEWARVHGENWGPKP